MNLSDGEPLPHVTRIKGSFYFRGNVYNILCPCSRCFAWRRSNLRQGIARAINRGIVAGIKELHQQAIDFEKSMDFRVRR